MLAISSAGLNVVARAVYLLDCCLADTYVLMNVWAVLSSYKQISKISRVFDKHNPCYWMYCPINSQWYGFTGA